MCSELNEKRDMVSNSIEKNAKLELEVVELGKQLSETHSRINAAESTLGENSTLKNELMMKNEELIKLKHEYDTEKHRKEKVDEKLEYIRDEYKKLKNKVKKFSEENTNLQHQVIDAKNQFHVVKARYESIADQNYNEAEKTNQLQDELNETRKKLEHVELKCVSYSQKFELLLKKYANRKTKYKAKMEKLWEYTQREKTKYKDLLANAQSDLINTKTSLEKEAEFKNKQENSYQQIIEEKRNLLASMIDKDAKMRDMKRQNGLLQSKIKLFEEEMENLHEKIDHTLKERNKFRKDVHMSILPHNDAISRSISPTMSTVSTQFGQMQASQNYIEPFKTTLSNNFFSSTNIYGNNWDTLKMNRDLKSASINAMNNITNFDYDYSASFVNGSIGIHSNGFKSEATTPRTFIN